MSEEEDISHDSKHVMRSCTVRGVRRKGFVTGSVWQEKNTCGLCHRMEWEGKCRAAVSDARRRVSGMTRRDSEPRGSGRVEAHIIKA